MSSRKTVYDIVIPPDQAHHILQLQKSLSQTQ